MKVGPIIEKHTYIYIYIYIFKSDYLIIDLIIHIFIQ